MNISKSDIKKETIEFDINRPLTTNCILNKKTDFQSDILKDKINNPTDALILNDKIDKISSKLYMMTNGNSNYNIFNSLFHVKSRITL